MLNAGLTPARCLTGLWQVVSRHNVGGAVYHGGGRPWPRRRTLQQLVPVSSPCFKHSAAAGSRQRPNTGSTTVHFLQPDAQQYDPRGHPSCVTISRSSVRRSCRVGAGIATGVGQSEAYGVNLDEEHAGGTVGEQCQDRMWLCPSRRWQSQSTAQSSTRATRGAFQKGCRGGQGIGTAPFSGVSDGHGVSGGQFLQLDFSGARAVRGETWREITGVGGGR